MDGRTGPNFRDYSDAIGVTFYKILAMTYFRMGKPHTIIGDTPFHF